MKLESFRRWVPLLGVAYISAAVIAEGFGLTALSSALKAIGGVVDIGQYSPVSAGELGAAAAALAGVVLKVLSVAEKAKAGKQ